MPALARMVGHDILHFPWNGHVPHLLPGRSPAVVTLHDVLPLEIPDYFPSARDERAYRGRIQSDLDRADVVLTTTEYSRRRISEEFRIRQEPQVILWGVNSQGTANETLPDRRPLQIDAPFFLFSGGFDPRKRVELAISAVCELWRLHDLRIPLVVVGEVRLYSEELKRTFDIGSRLGAVRALGYVSEGDLVELYSRALAMVYPSRFEGFGLPPLEAMACGCPVVTCRATSIPEVCGNAVLYLDPADERGSLVDALTRIATNPDARRTLVDLGLARARQFSWPAAARRYLNIVGAAVRAR